MRLPGFITRNFRLKVLASVIASITWAGAVYAANPPEIRVVSVAVPQAAADIPARWVLVHAIPDLQLRLSGTREHLDAFSTSSIRVTPLFDKISGPGTQELPVEIVNADPNVTVVNPPDTISVDVDRLTSKDVAVGVVLSPGPPAGYVARSEDIGVDPKNVTVTGPESELNGISVRATLDLSHQKANFTGQVNLFTYDAKGNRLSDLSTNPPTATVTITIHAVSTSRTSAVVPPIRGSVASGYQLSGISVSSPTVVLTGPQDLLNSLDSVTTSAVIVTGLTGNRTFTVTVQPPAGVTADPTTVSVTVFVQPVPGAATPTPTPAQPPPT